ncbi:MAG: ComF family protein [Gammaproteobacteria bacterium]|nr:MAG: ComF family protein [Gammaproteobacteria bacterium]
MVYNYREWLSLLLFPSQCRLCGVTTGTALKLCPQCLADSPWIKNACQQCSAPLPTHADDSHCGHCQKRPPAFDTTTALFHYRPPVDYLIKQLKFANELAIIPLLSALLSARLTTRAAPLPSLLIPVPLHQTRLRERGFNQATELARRVGRELGIRSDHRLCTRNRDTRPQSLLSPNARRLNLRNAFSVKRKQIAGHVAIIDDVMTTGQTSNELARVLRQAGAEQIEVWVIARAG